MKKLMIAAAIVCAAVLSQAAQCNWSLSSVTDSPSNTKAAGWAEYLLAASDFEAFSKLDADKVAAFVAENAIATGETTKNARTGGVNANGSTGNIFATGQKANAFLVIFDNANAANSDYFAYTATKESLPVAESGAAISLDWSDFATETAGQGGWKATTVPEPTSGLLLLIGMAGLALRRRRA